MAKRFDGIDDKLAAWIAAQKMFLVATAPLSAAGHVNLSPKGGEAFRILGPTEVAYQDYTGSGAETAAHVRENGRIVIMFCAFEGPPRIVRLHGQGTLLPLGTPRFDELAKHFPPNLGTRAFIQIALSRISDSCGYSVPLYNFVGQRDVLDAWNDRKGAAGLKAYREENNTRSLDGLPAFDSDSAAGH